MDFRDMETLEDLGQARLDAYKAFQEARQAYDIRLRDLEREARAKCDAEPVGVAFFAAQEAHRAADVAWRQESNTQTSANAVRWLADHGLAEGDRVEEWVPPNWDWNKPYKKTGTKGVVQVYRDGDEAACARARQGSLHNGNIVVRYLKKDGTPGIRVEKWGACWSKEGVPHPKAEQPVVEPFDHAARIKEAQDARTDGRVSI